jgi:hypothetical protein
VPREHAAEIDTVLDAMMDAYQASVEPAPYVEPTTADLLDNMDRREIEGSAKGGWEEMEKKARRQLNDAKTFRQSGKQRPFCVPVRDIGKRRRDDDE